MNNFLNKFLNKVLPLGFFGRSKVRNVAMADRLIKGKENYRAQEAYRMARTNLLYSGGGKDERMVFGFTSAAPGDGKSLTCANMAISFATSGKRVLLLDCDMRKPTQDTAFGVSTERGLSEYLAAICDAPEILPTSRPNLYLLPAGHCPPNPAELLYSPRFAELIARVQKEYDCVFIDLPPVNILSDATIIAPHVKGYVLVVRASYSDSRAVQTAVNAIEAVGGTVSGFILNDVDFEEGGYYGRYGKYKRGGYGKYGYGKYGYYHYGPKDKDGAADAFAKADEATDTEKTDLTAEEVAGNTEEIAVKGSDEATVTDTEEKGAADEEKAEDDSAKPKPARKPRTAKKQESADASAE